VAGGVIDYENFTLREAERIQWAKYYCYYIPRIRNLPHFLGFSHVLLYIYNEPDIKIKGGKL
jgi:hypothetical protein